MASESPTATHTRLDGIQWGRALAALLVVVCHAILHPLPELSSFALYLGDVGVTIFFIISGFIMVTTTGRAQFDPWLFMRRRIIRIVPMYYLATLVVVFFTLFLPSLMKSTQFDLQHVLLSLLFVPTYTPSTGALLPFFKLGWTLNFEMFFYLVFALLSFVGLRARMYAILALFGALAVLGLLFRFDNAILAFYTRMDVLAFAAGVVLASVKDWRPWRVRRAVGAAGLAMGSAVIVGVYVIYGSIHASALAHLAVILAGTGLVAVFATHGQGGENWAARSGVLLGDASYSLYLFHIFVVAAVWVGVGRIFGALDLLPFVTVVVLASVASVLVCVVIHLVLEKPLTRVLNGYLGRRARPAAA